MFDLITVLHAERDSCTGQGHKYWETDTPSPLPSSCLFNNTRVFASVTLSASNFNRFKLSLHLCPSIRRLFLSRCYLSWLWHSWLSSRASCSSYSSCHYSSSHGLHARLLHHHRLLLHHGLLLHHWLHSRLHHLLLLRICGLLSIPRLLHLLLRISGGLLLIGLHI